jgi:hypothetical protein
MNSAQNIPMMRTLLIIGRPKSSPRLPRRAHCMAISFQRRALGGTVAWPLALLIGAVVASVALSIGAVAQKAQLPLNTLKAIGEALQACRIPPPINQAQPGMQITVMMSFKRNGELFGRPKITFESLGASDDERLAYRIAVAQRLKRCTPLPFTDALGSAVAGRPFAIRFIDNRKLKEARFLRQPRSFLTLIRWRADNVQNLSHFQDIDGFF